MNKEHACINCQNLHYNKQVSKHYCKAWSHGDNRTWVEWPEDQTCGIENIGYGTGKFLTKTAHDRIQKLKSLGI
jgi:hypothetical protein